MAVVPSTDFGYNSSTVPLLVWPPSGNEAYVVDTQLSQGQNPNMALVTLTQGATFPPATVAVPYTATENLDLSLSRLFTTTLTGNVTFTTTNQASGSQFQVEIKQDATGSRTGTFPASWLFVGGSKTLTTTASATDKVTCVYDGTNFLCELNKAYA